MKSLQGEIRFAESLRDIFGTFLASKMVLPDLLALAHSWRPDMILRDPMGPGAVCTAEALNIPHAASGPLFRLFGTAPEKRPAPR